MKGYWALWVHAPFGPLDPARQEDDILGIATLPSHRFQEKGFEGHLASP